MKAEEPTRPWSLLWVALGASLWGTDTLLRRPLTSQLSSAQIVMAEHLILTIVLLPMLWRSRKEWLALRPLQWGAVLGIAWGGSALGTICFTEAIKIGNPTAAVFLQKLQPLFTGILAALLLGEPLGRRFWGCLAVALAGAYLVSFGDQPELLLHPVALAETRGLAALLALAAAGFWAASTVFGRFVLKSLSLMSLTALRIICAAPLLVALAGSPQFAIRLTGGQAASILLMALVPGLVALLVYYRGLRYTRASLAALAELSFPATAAVLNWTFLGARVGALQLAGFGLVWGVILFLERGTHVRPQHV